MGGKDVLVYLQMMDSETDRSKFEQLFVRYKGLMFHVAMEKLQNVDDAEDAVSQAFIAIADNIHKISQIDCQKTKSLVVIVTENKALDMIRQRRKVIPMELDKRTTGMDIPLPGDCGLADAIAVLPAQQREVVLLCGDGYKPAEIAKILGISPSNVYKILQRARKVLEKAMKGEL